MITRAQEAGLHLQWRDHNYGRPADDGDYNWTTAEQEDLEHGVIALEHLQYAFLLLALGHSVATAVFLTQHVHYRTYTHSYTSHYLN